MFLRPFDLVYIYYGTLKIYYLLTCNSFSVYIMINKIKFFEDKDIFEKKANYDKIK